MPRYYFDIHDGEHLTEDDLGVPLRGREDARAAAIDVLPNFARDVLSGDGDRRSLVATVRDEGGRPVFQATLTLSAEWLDEPGTA